MLANRAAQGSIAIHPLKMKATCLQLTARASNFIKATPKAVPVRYFVVDTGNDSRLASSTVKTAHISVAKPLVELIVVIRLPSARKKW